LYARSVIGGQLTGAARALGAEDAVITRALRSVLAAALRTGGCGPYWRLRTEALGPEPLKDREPPN